MQHKLYREARFFTSREIKVRLRSVDPQKSRHIFLITQTLQHHVRSSSLQCRSFDIHNYTVDLKDKKLDILS